MDEAAKCQLVALATAQVRARIEAMMDFEAARAKGREYMASAATVFGMPAIEGQSIYESGFPAFKESMLAWATKTAQAEVTKAVEEAEVEQERHAALLADLRQDHEQTVLTLVERHLRAVPEEADAALVALINSSHKDMMSAVQRFNDDLMKVVVEKHRLNLWHCFARHSIPEGSVLVQLVELYEVQ